MDRTRNRYLRGFDKCTRRVSSSSVSFRSLYDDQPSPNKVNPPYHRRHHQKDKILDPQGQFLEQWNKIFLISCLFSLAVDPLFFYIPILDRKNKCLKFDSKWEIMAFVLRTVSDLLYLLHIIIQFRTSYPSPSSCRFGRLDMVKDPGAIAKRYLLSYFFVDVLAVLPLPQVTVALIIPRIHGAVASEGLLKAVVFSQYIPRLFRMYPIYKQVMSSSGMIAKTAWAGAAFNLFLYMLASHVVGAAWYLYAIDLQYRCWHESCQGAGCNHMRLYCNDKQRNYTFNETHCAPVDPNEAIDSGAFNFGIFYDVLHLKIVESEDFFKKLSYCFLWGLQNLSALGQGLNTSGYIWENLFIGFICVFGLILFASLIGNIQTYIQSTTVLVEEMRVRSQGAEEWMSYRVIPEDLRKRIRRYEQYKWQETRGVDVESLLSNLPRDLRRDIKRHLCLDLLRRLPIFEIMDEGLMNAICDRLKPVLYTEKSIIAREGDPENEMLFVTKGRLETITTHGERTGFFNSVFLEAGDFCGEELLTWALEPRSSNLPLSTRTVWTMTDVEAFTLMPDDLRFVVSKFRQLHRHSRQLQHTLRFYSQQWRRWAAFFIQIAWRRHCRRKVEKSLGEAEDRLKNALANTGGTSQSLGAAIYASKFAVNALRLIRRDDTGNVRVQQRLPPILYLRKPTDLDFSSGDG